MNLLEKINGVSMEDANVEIVEKKDPIVISGFPGIGKSTLYNSNKELVITDSDSSKFPKDNFPTNYIEHIQSLIDGGETDVILISSHEVVREALKDAGIEYVLVYPNKTLKDTYIERYEQRGSPEAFVKLLDDQWDNWITECEEFEGLKYELKEPEDNLTNNFEEIVKVFNE